ncbi:MAG: hypothetical protein KGO48_07360 [Alphaproteobacteria bacterium]|nr:hypothetical protein [Alphaproteobacteria bacterium]
MSDRRSPKRRSAPAKVNPRGYTSKQMGDACEMLVAGELTLAGIPALRVPDTWPRFDVIAEKPDGSLHRISVKSRTKRRGGFINFEPSGFDWLAVVLLENNHHLFFIVPREVVATDELSRARTPSQIERSPGSRSIPLTATYLKRLLRFEDNFKLESNVATLGTVKSGH